ncbi:MAG: DinB family protein [Candidatus Latescibacterota bacterium]
MTDKPRFKELLHLLDPESGKRLWFGGATPLGCLRGVSPARAAWKPAAERHSIWELTLHIAYWKYAVRRNLEGSPTGGFPRSPSNWPDVPKAIDANTWKQDRVLLKTEHEALIKAVRGLDDKMLDVAARGSGAYRLIDLLYGIVMHDTYHVGQIQVLKRLSGNVRK